MTVRLAGQDRRWCQTRELHDELWRATERLRVREQMCADSSASPARARADGGDTDFRNKFLALHKSYSPNQAREIYVVSTRATSYAVPARPKAVFLPRNALVLICLRTHKRIRPLGLFKPCRERLLHHAHSSRYPSFPNARLSIVCR